MNNKIIKARKKGVGIFCKHGRTKFLFGKNLLATFKKEIKIGKSQIIRGRIAYRGVVRGKVRVVF